MTETTAKKFPYSIVFVDDEEQARKYFDKGLRSHYNILTAGSVEEAQKIIEENHQNIAVVVSDQRMPGGNGVILLEFLRNRYPDIIRILTTAYSDLTDAIASVNKGEIFRYIQKPWDYELLKTEMAQAMELFMLRNEYNNMLYEKMAIRKKMNRMDRLRFLLIAAKTLPYLRFSDNAIANFIKQLATQNNESENSDFQNQEMGGGESSEILFTLNILDKIAQKFPTNSSYNFDQKFSLEEIKSIFEKHGISCHAEGSGTSELSSFGLEIFAKELALVLKELKIEDQKLNLKVENNNLILELNSTQASFPQGSNIFLVSPNLLKSEIYLNLLACYFVAAHHGGTIAINCNNGNVFNFKASIPLNPHQSQLDKIDAAELLEDMTVLFA